MKKQGFLYGSLILVGSVLIAKIAGALFKIPLANLLGGAGMGYFSCAYGLYLPVYAVCVTGLPTAVAKLTAENAALGQYASLRKLKNVSLALFSLIGLIASALVILLAEPFCAYVTQTPEAAPAVMAIAPSIFFGCVLSVYRGYFEGLRNMYPTALSQIAEGVVKLAAGLLLCQWTLELASSQPEEFLRLVSYFQSTEGCTAAQLALPYAAAAAVFGVTLSTAAAFLFLFFRHRALGDGIPERDAHQGSVPASRRLISSLMKILIPVAIGSLVTNLTSLIDLATIVRCLNQAMSRDASLFSGLAVGRTEAANFVYGSFTGLAVTVFNLVPSFTNMFGKGVLPSLTEAWAVRDQKRVQKTAEGVLMVTSLAACPAGLGIAFLSKEILELLYSGRTEEIAVSAPSLTILGVAVVCLALSAPIFAMLQAIGRAGLPVKIMFLGVLVKLAGNLLLIPVPRLNAAGAALSTLACYVLIVVLSLSALHKHAKVRLPLSRLIVKPLYAAALCGMTAKLLEDVLRRSIDSRLALFLAIAGGGLIYLFCLWLLGEWKAARQLWSQPIPQPGAASPQQTPLV